MQNFTQEGKVITVTAPATITAGQLVVIGLLVGVAVHDAASGAPVEIQTEGVFEVAKTSAQAWATVGLAIYVVPATGLATTATTSGNVLIGTNLAAAANPSGTGIVRLNGSIPAAAA